MTATNQQMTSEQLADLSTLSAQLLCKAEANDDRDTAVMAYAVQRACSELEESRREFTAANATIHNLELKLEQVVAENDRAVKAVTVFSNVTHDITEIICDELGQERVAEIVAAYIFTKLPLSSADSTNVARNIGIDKAWSGAYAPASKETRATLMVERIESHNSPGSLAYCEQRDRFDMQLQLAV